MGKSVEWRQGFKEGQLVAYKHILQVITDIDRRCQITVGRKDKEMGGRKNEICDKY